ncbi:ABC transporter permease [Paenibacillus flagellatus]|uniref:Transport permease protein n=1 Tax=Paenibacillus flagellatus TaxID=2211139 RepID=A0A2V5KCM1_9BACL|nr:ABC transporter permease [Paenibacillus flagellatus]PYI57369.1 ABC transporter [Paenibacillus flagellatus]
MNAGRQHQTEAILRGRSAPGSPSAWSATTAFLWRSLRHAKSQSFDFVLEVVVSPVLMLLIFTVLFGGAVAGSTEAYIPYLLPGVLVLTVVPMTVYSGTSICSDIAKGVYNRFRTMPFWQPASVLGLVVADGLRYVVALLAAFGAGLLLGFRPEGGMAGAVLSMLFIVLFAFSASWIFSAIGVMAARPETVSGSSMIVVYPLLFASNILVDSATMPPWIGRIVDWNPVSVAVSAARGLMAGTASASVVAAGIGVCLLFVAVFAPLTFYLYLTKKQ